MKVAFPHMGNVYIMVKGLLDDLNVDYVISPVTSKKTLELGSLYVPEGACLPLKITVGNLIQGYELGADTHLMTGSWGPCRFGYYCQMQKEILEDIGIKMDTIILENCHEGVGELIKRIRKLVGNFNVSKISKAAKNSTAICKKVDELERLYRNVASTEKYRGSAQKIYNNFRKDVLDIYGSKEILKKIESTKVKLLSVPIDLTANPLKIAIVGEIYGTIDPWTNFQLESRLCSMGIMVERKVTISNWVMEHMVKSSIPFLQDKDYKIAAKNYINHCIGGHTWETVGHSVMHAKEGFDGIIQLYPLGCMPEIVAQSLLAQVSKDYNIPILTLVMDEMTGEAGYITRVEAFIDLLERKKKQNKAMSALEAISG